MLPHEAPTFRGLVQPDGGVDTFLVEAHAIPDGALLVFEGSASRGWGTSLLEVDRLGRLRWRTERPE